MENFKVLRWYAVDPPFGAIRAAAHFATWKSLAPPRVFSWEAGAKSDDAFRMPMEGWQVAWGSAGRCLEERLLLLSE